MRERASRLWKGGRTLQGRNIHLRDEKALLAEQLETYEEKSKREIMELQEQVSALEGSKTDIEIENHTLRMEKAELEQKLGEGELAIENEKGELEKEKKYRRVAEKRLAEIRKLVDGKE